ncbi:MAG: GAF domain-containing protein [Firmicutes bacterium]|nr:GAF domain-containing protein [Bacillota bacterium]MDY6161062.1 GAF domain-containing protein [Candidatus Faecousia sp.]
MNSFYSELAAKLNALMEGVPYQIANLANASALLWQELPDINWVGFYQLLGDRLVLGPFQGKPACIQIPLGKGVCGKAAAEERVLRVENVHEFPGHIACDSASNSEIVLPLYRLGKIWGVLDIDSPLFSRFSQEDEAQLGLISELLGKMLSEAE